MNIKEMSALIGRRGKWNATHGIDVDVEIVDVRQAYGRTDYQIRAIAGTGSAWVTAHTVQLEKSDK